MAANQSGAGGHSPPSYQNAAYVSDGTEGSIPLEPAPRQFLPRITTGKEEKPTPSSNIFGSPEESRFSVKNKDLEGQSTPTSGSSTVGSGVALEKSDGDGDDDADEDRATWGNPIEFLMSCISMSVGLGNVWRFPGTAARNGGGAFLIPYLIVLLVIGRPLYYMEMCLGQFSRYGQVKVWNMAPLFKGVGYASSISVICVFSYYCALMAITIFYFFASFAKTLPWEICHPDKLPKNTTCVQGMESQLYFDYTVMPKVPNLDDGLGDIHWRLVLCLIFSWILVFGALVKGVQSSGKVAYFTAIFPYVVLFILLIRGVTLEGAWEGIKIFLEPEWSRLKDPNVWYSAVAQCFFSLTAGFGPVIMFSSYNRFNQNIYRDALIISFMDTFTSLLAGITIYAVMGNLIVEEGLDPETIGGGPGLAFVLYPQALGKFGWAKQLLSVLFFLMLFTLGIGSATALTGSVITTICDQFRQWKRWMVTAVVCSCGCLAGLLFVTQGGLMMLELIDNFGASIVIYIMAMIESFAVCYVYGLNRWCNDIEFMIGHRINLYWKICWAIILPVGLLGNLLYYLIDNGEYTYDGIRYPRAGIICAWLLTGFAVAQVPIWGIHAIYTRKSSGFVAKFKEALKPTRHWGPQKPKLRREWQEFRAVEDKKNKWFVIW